MELRSKKEFDNFFKEIPNYIQEDINKIKSFVEEVSPNKFNVHYDNDSDKYITIFISAKEEFKSLLKDGTPFISIEIVPNFSITVDNLASKSLYETLDEYPELFKKNNELEILKSIEVLYDLLITELMGQGIGI